MPCRFKMTTYSAYHNLKLTRDDKGVLVAEFHSQGGPCVMTAQSHTEFVEAFYRISQSQLSSHCVGSYSLDEAYILSDQMLGGLPPSLCVDRLGELTSRGFLPTDCRCRRFE